MSHRTGSGIATTPNSKGLRRSYRQLGMRRPKLAFGYRGFAGVAARRLPNQLKRQTGAELDFAPRGGGFADSAELRGVHEAVRRAEIGVIEGVEEFGAELKFGALGEIEGAGERQVKGLHAGAINGVAAHMAEGERSRRREGCGTNPWRGGVRAGRENWLAGEVGAD